MEESAKKVSDLEIDKYLNTDYKNFGENVVSTSKQLHKPTFSKLQIPLQENRLYFLKKLLKIKKYPISRKGDSLMLTKMYTDEGLINIKKKNNTPEPPDLRN